MHRYMRTVQSNPWSSLRSNSILNTICDTKKLTRVVDANTAEQNRSKYLKCQATLCASKTDYKYTNVKSLLQYILWASRFMWICCVTTLSFVSWWTSSFESLLSIVIHDRILEELPYNQDSESWTMSVLSLLQSLVSWLDRLGTLRSRTELAFCWYRIERVLLILILALWLMFLP